MRHMMRDIVSLVKKDGQRIDNIRASVQSNKIITFDSQHPIEEGDTYERKLPSGVVEQYLILDAGYQSGIGGISAHYQSSVRKNTKIQAPTAAQQVTYNLHGENSRVNINSTDASTNIVNISSNEIFVKLEEAARTVQDSSVRAILLEEISRMKVAQNQPDFTAKYQSFIAAAANHMTVFAPFIPALTQLLGKF